MADDKKIIFSMNKVSKTYSSTNKQVLKDIYLSFFYGAKIGILGLNGAGKSSLLKIIAGVDKNYQGEVVFAPGYTVGYLEQEPKLDEEKTVIEAVREGVAETVKLLDEFNHINDLFGLEENYSDPDKMQKLMDKQAELQDRIDALNAWELDNQLEVAMDALRTPDPDTPIKVLSGGERRRVALCRLLLQQPDVLLLDEPTNHLDAESVLWLEQHLQQYAGTVIAVTHDRYFLDNVAGWILELDRGEGIPWKGNYSSWLDQKAKRLAQEQKAETKRQKVLERELEWVRQGAKGRQAKQKARLQNYDRLLSEDQKQLEEVGQKVDKSRWRMTPQTVNAYYNPMNNEIVFPAAILQPPFFSFDADPAVNFGGIGAVIGHEMSHGFDDSGAEYDGDGNLKNWWSDKDKENFKKVTKALAAQFDKYEPVKGHFVNGTFTSGENIADLGGVNIAYDALQLYLKEHGKVGKISGYTQNQRFFLSWATVWRSIAKEKHLINQVKTDPHTPQYIRAYAPLLNIDAWYKAFDVKEGDKLYKKPQERVKIW